MNIAHTSTRPGDTPEADVATDQGIPPWMLGQNITRLRRAANLNQFELGALLPSNSSRGHVTRQTVSRWETGQCMPERHHLRALAGIFGITEAQLFEEPPPVDGEAE